MFNHKMTRFAYLQFTNKRKQSTNYYLLNSGFTLVEILVVVSIIGLLLSVTLFGVGGARESARDAKRKSDIELIRSGLELYKADCKGYPVTLSLVGGTSSLVGTGATTACAIANTYISPNPADPMHPTRSFVYAPVGTVGPNGANAYEICASLEGGGTAVTSGQCAAGCGTGMTCNYRVTQP